MGDKYLIKLSSALEGIFSLITSAYCPRPPRVSSLLSRHYTTLSGGGGGGGEDVVSFVMLCVEPRKSGTQYVLIFRTRN